MLIRFGRRVDNEFVPLKDVRVKGSIEDNSNKLFDLFRIHGTKFVEELEGKPVRRVASKLSIYSHGGNKSTYQTREGILWSSTPIAFSDGTEADWCLEADFYNEGYVVRLKFNDKDDLYFLRNTKKFYKGRKEKSFAHIFSDEKTLLRYLKNEKHQREFNSMVPGWNVRKFEIEHASDFYAHEHGDKEDLGKIQEAQNILDTFTGEFSNIAANPYDEALARMETLGLPLVAIKTFEETGNLYISGKIDILPVFRIVAESDRIETERIKLLRENGHTPYHIIKTEFGSFYLYVSGNTDRWRYEKPNPLRSTVKTLFFRENEMGYWHREEKFVNEGGLLDIIR